MAAKECCCMMIHPVASWLFAGLPTPNSRGAQEECRGWDVNEVVFTPALWPIYQALMRADFTLFDEYQFSGTGAPPILELGSVWNSPLVPQRSMSLCAWHRAASRASMHVVLACPGRCAGRMPAHL